MSKNDGSVPYERGHPARATSELTLRIASGFVMASVVLAATLWGDWPFALIWAVAGGGVAYEWLALAGGDTAPGRVRRSILSILVGLSALALQWAGVGVAILVVVTALVALCLMDRQGNGLPLRLGGIAYAAVIALVPVAAREAPWGLVTILWMFGVVWTTDVLAYACGRLIGGAKLWPRVSPKKTWSGFIGGVTAGTLVGWFVLASPLSGGPAPMSAVAMILLSLGGAVASQAGDLAESLLKRHLGVKDSGHIIPGHGGLMDRLDSFWAVAALVGCLLIVQFMRG